MGNCLVTRKGGETYTIGTSTCGGSWGQTGSIIDTGSTDEKPYFVTACGVNESSSDYSYGYVNGSNDKSNWTRLYTSGSDNLKSFGGAGTTSSGTTSYRYICAYTSAKGGGSRARCTVTTLVKGG